MAAKKTAAKKKSPRSRRVVTKERGPGRPSKFTADVRKRVLDAVRAGNYLETASAYGGITYSTLNNWMNRGEKLSNYLPDDDDEQRAFVAGMIDIEREYLEFFEMIMAESAKAEMQAVMQIRVAAQGTPTRPADWRADAFLITHRYPERWGRRVEQRELSGPKGKPIAFKDETPIVSDADRLNRIQKLMAAGA